LHKVNQIFIKTENAFVIIGIILTMIITFTNVITRYVFHIGVGWSEELVRFIMIWITFIGMGIAIRTNEHVSIDFFYNLLDVKKRKYASHISYFIATFFCAFLFVSGFILTMKVFRLGQISAGLQIRMGFIYLILPISTFISMIRYAVLVFTGDTEG